jgi:hypothetical protein
MTSGKTLHITKVVTSTKQAKATWHSVQAPSASLVQAGWQHMSAILPGKGGRSARGFQLKLELESSSQECASMKD